MKNISSKRAKACAISQKVKQKVYERDEGLCVICGRPGLPEAHYIPRSQGGLGIEENIVTLCRSCHNDYDQGGRVAREVLGRKIRDYLRKHYDNWCEYELKYDKWRDIWKDIP